MPAGSIDTVTADRLVIERSAAFMKIELQIAIAAPDARVFAVLSDPASWPGIIPGILSVEVLTPAPFGVGTRFRETRMMHGRRASEEMTVAAIEPDHLLVLTAESHGARYRATHAVEGLSANNCRLKLVFSGEPVTLLARLLTPIALLMRGAVRRQLAADLDAIKAFCEVAGGDGQS